MRLNCYHEQCTQNILKIGTHDIDHEHISVTHKTLEHNGLKRSRDIATTQLKLVNRKILP